MKPNLYVEAKEETHLERKGTSLLLKQEGEATDRGVSGWANFATERRDFAGKTGMGLVWGYANKMGLRSRPGLDMWVGFWGKAIVGRLQVALL